MQLTVLMDNHTLIDRYFIGEPGVSYLIRDGATQVLFDVGYSGAFIANAIKMKESLLQTDFIVLSHGHLDHTWGLDPLLRMYTEAALELLPFSRPTLVAHPDVFQSRSVEGVGEIGCIVAEAKLARHVGMRLTKTPWWLTERLVFLGEIARNNDFENAEPVGMVHGSTGSAPDFVRDDSALAYKGDDGLVIITGCSHAGICNIIEQARQVCGEERIADVIGGFHLTQSARGQLERTVDYFRTLRPARVHACHCVDLFSKIALSKVSNLMEVGVGLCLEYK